MKKSGVGSINYSSEREKELLRFSSRDAGLGYSFGVVVPTLVGVIYLAVIAVIAYSRGGADYSEEYARLATSDWSYYILAFITPMSLLLATWFSTRRKADTYFRAFNFNSFSPKYILIVLAVCFGAIYGLGNLNNYFIEFLKKIGLSVPSSTVPLYNGWEYVLSLLFIAIMPALAEELLFRGVIFSGLKNCGTVALVLLSGVYFMLFHQSAQQTVYQFIMGAVFALVTLRSGSIIPAILMHFINNAYILTATYFGFGDYGSSFLTITAAVVFFAAAAYLIFFDRKRKAEKTESPKTFLLYSLFGVAFAAIMIIISLFGG